MNLLLDTHPLLWAAADPQRLSKQAAAFIEDDNNKLYLVAASIWEIVIKNELQRPEFEADPHVLRRGLVAQAEVEGFVLITADEQKADSIWCRARSALDVTTRIFQRLASGRRSDSSYGW